MSIQLPPLFPEKVEVLVVPFSKENAFKAAKEGSAQPIKFSGFVDKVLGDPSEDIWNDL